MAAVVDTHIIVWYMVEPARLSDAALVALEQAIDAGEPIYISAITIVELCYLIERDKLPAIVLERLLAAANQPNSGVAIVPLDQAISLAIQQVDRGIVPEMPDRIIAATALYLNCPLVTRDHKIQAFKRITTIW
jgi:PIN domain nuclease of toxin-antitoxin system